MKEKSGGIYTNDGKRLLKAPNVKLFRIAEGCQEVDPRAFDDCEDLVCLYFPQSMSDEAVEFTIDNLPYSIVSTYLPEPQSHLVQEVLKENYRRNHYLCTRS